MADGVGARGGGNHHGYWLMKVGVFSVLLGLGGRRVCCEKSRFGVRLNSKRWKTDRQFRILRGASCRDVASFLVFAVCFNEH